MTWTQTKGNCCCKNCVTFEFYVTTVPIMSGNMGGINSTTQQTFVYFRILRGVAVIQDWTNSQNDSNIILTFGLPQSPYIWTNGPPEQVDMTGRFTQLSWSSGGKTYQTIPACSISNPQDQDVLLEYNGNSNTPLYSSEANTNQIELCAN